ncbi:uncharacterized protein LOC135143654 [Zophobas morio]|uniref:uncharacterized protein LOC135143654 n=1 Tax=Zophobas morio TaxID=2755281 RepID=UPI003083173D
MESCGEEAEEKEFLAQLISIIVPKVFVPPLNFAMVEPGIYRSGYPGKKNFPFLKQLNIKTIICLDPVQYRNEDYLIAENVKLFQYPVNKNKEPLTLIPQYLLADALSRMLDKANYPILVHCNKGKYRVGCAVGCLRKLQNLSKTFIFAEYQKFSGAKARVLDQQYIELFDVSLVKYDKESAPEWL